MKWPIQSLLRNPIWQKERLLFLHYPYKYYSDLSMQILAICRQSLVYTSLGAQLHSLDTEGWVAWKDTRPSRAVCNSSAVGALPSHPGKHHYKRNNSSCFVTAPQSTFVGMSLLISSQMIHNSLANLPLIACYMVETLMGYVLKATDISSVLRIVSRSTAFQVQTLFFLVLMKAEK